MNTEVISILQSFSFTKSESIILDTLRFGVYMKLREIEKYTSLRQSTVVEAVISLERKNMIDTVIVQKEKYCKLKNTLSEMLSMRNL